MLRTLLLGVISLWLIAAIVREPDGAFQAALQGLTIWWNIVFPGLLPFLVLSELLLAFGAVHGLGALLDPLMRRSFGLPGAAGWALVLGWIAGFPAGAEATASLRKDGSLSRKQAQRLLAAAHMPSPVLMIVVIGAGFLKRPDLGLLIAMAVWGSALLLALAAALFRKPAEPAAAPQRPNRLWMEAAQSMTDAHNRDGRTFGKALGDAVMAGVQKLMAVGGYMITGSVLASIAGSLIPAAWNPLGFSGLYEAHLGAYEAGLWLNPYGAPLTAAAVAAVLGWGGWSALLQVRSAIASTDLRFGPFLAGRLLHAALAFGLAIALWRPFASLMKAAAPGFAGANSETNGAVVSLSARDLPSLWPALPITSASLLLLLSLLVAASLFAARKRSA